MRIYQAEKDDGVDFQINKFGSSTSFVTAQVQVCDIEKYFDGMSIADIIKNTNTVQTVEQLLGQEQLDLALIVAILVSTGWNLNDDVFVPEEVWKARLSPINKPMNDNHDANKILGHIVKSRALDKSGNEIELSDSEILPDNFDLEVAGVLYKAFPELSERINEIITKAQTGDMYVSMEAWFPDFGYGFVDPTTGDTKLVERTEATAFLTKHLRIYGGSGEYQGYKVGRVLKNIIFGAQGFVDNPANPESVIKVAANKMAVSRNFVIAELNDLLEGGVEDVDEKQLQELQAKFEEAQTTLESNNKEIVELQKVVKDVQSKDYEGQIVALNTKVEELTTNATEASEKVKVVEAANVELQKKLDEATERADKSVAELNTIRKNEAARDRLAKLSKVKKVEDEEATLAELREMTDETFEVVLKYAGKANAKEAVTESETVKENEAGQVEAALNDVEEDKGADFNVASEDASVESEAKWLSTAKALCGRKENEQGGE